MGRILRLKGGSLSNTSLHEEDDKKFIRKSINTKENREYGYVRWYSQLKKLQQFGATGLFPKLLRVGTTDNGAYFDIEYLEGYRDIKTILTEDSMTYDVIEKINEAVWRAFDNLHRKIYFPIKGAGALYFKEEVVQKLSDAFKYQKFYNFYESGLFDAFEYNGEITHGIQNYLPELNQFFIELNLTTEENIHGNPTLENMMYSFKDDRVMFVDPYEESCIDSRLLDYSQVLQCSRSYYGFINDREVTVDGTSVSFHGEIPQNFKIFNTMFELKIEPTDKKIIDVLEATQFIRMLPFKCAAGETEKAMFFYVHACHLLSRAFK
jgi:hypothetical protein